tara:strand:- start:8441 stop:9352 length:912 start_codon:yes stop_codon:yes gene_type:complete
MKSLQKKQHLKSLLIYFKKKNQFVSFILLLLFLFLALLLKTSAQSSGKIQNKKIFLPNVKDQKYSIELLPEWKSIEKGMGLQEINLFNQSEEIEMQLRLYKFNPALFNIRVLCSKNYGKKRIDVRTLAKLSGTVAIINSSYFDAQGSPLAYLRCNGKVINSKVASHSLYSGVFFMRQGRPYIVHTSRFDPKTDASDVVQVGPRLISKGANTIGLKNIHAVHHRSGIALDKKGNVIIFATNSEFGGISWNILRHILKLKKIGGYEVLNLDGGGSTQMYISTKNYEDYVRGLSPVPSAIAFFRKE